ncbi:GTPase IMAP family member 8, partial [Biomphalaria glabrata]
TGVFVVALLYGSDEEVGGTPMMCVIKMDRDWLIIINMRPVKELANVATKLETLEDLVQNLQDIIADITNVIKKCSAWVDETEKTTYQDIQEMLVSKTCQYIQQLFQIACERNNTLSVSAITDEQMRTISQMETLGSDIKGSLVYKRLEEKLKDITATIESQSERIDILQERNESFVKEKLKEITASVESQSERIDILQDRNESLVKEKLQEITASVKTQSDITTILQEKHTILEKTTKKLWKQNQDIEKISEEHYKEIMEELSVASSFMSNLKDENIKLSLDLTEHNKKIEDVSDKVYKEIEKISEFAKDKHIIDERQKQIKKLTDDSLSLGQLLKNAKENIKRLKVENAKYQASLETKELENKKLAQKLGLFPNDILKRVHRSLRKKNINFLLLGRSGTGKSALGNSILQSKCFEVGLSLEPVHTEVQCEIGLFNGREVQVFELPDLYYKIDEKQPEAFFQVTKDKIVNQCSQGFSVILLVLRSKSQFKIQSVPVNPVWIQCGSENRVLFGKMPRCQESLMRPVKELIDVATKLETLEDLVQHLQDVISDITNVIKKCSAWVDETEKTTYQDIQEMLVSKTCQYIQQLFQIACERNSKLSESAITDEQMRIISQKETFGSDVKGSFVYKRLEEKLQEITASVESQSERIDILQDKNESLVKEKLQEITASVKTQSDITTILQEKHTILEKTTKKLSKQNQDIEKISQEHYEEIMEELSVASSFMSNLKDENIKLSTALTEHNKKIEDVSDKVYKGIEIVSEFAKDQHILDELRKENKKLTDDSSKDKHHLDELKKQIQKHTDESAELMQHLDNSKDSIEKLKEENAKYQASLETKEIENIKLKEKLAFFPKDILERVESRSLIDVRKKHINFLLLGHRCTGKSALGNSILQRKCFKVGFSTKPIHTEVQCEMGEFNGRGIRVFELPDPYYGIDEKQSKDLLIKVTKDKIVDQCSHGFSVILFVHRCESRITYEHSRLIEAFKSIFGQNSLKDYGILVMTYGDYWKMEFIKGKSFQDRIQHEGNFKQILTEFNGRALLFDNRTIVKEEQTEQLQNLMDMVDKLILDHTFQTKSLMF